MIKEIKLKICMLKETGFFSIFVSTIFSKIIAFFGNVIIARIFCKNDYGIYSYVRKHFPDYETQIQTPRVSNGGLDLVLR